MLVSRRRTPALLVPFLLLFTMVIGTPPLDAAPSPDKADKVQPKPAADDTGPGKKERKNEQRRQANLAKELNKPFQRWLDEDVAYIITPDERAAFNRLQNAEEREQFIEQFWARRDPTPDTVENEYKEEHYRRIAYANEHFASGIPGWKTDRGRMYIMYGPPDDKETHASGGSYTRPFDEGGGTTSTFPFEIWHYHHIDGVGDDVTMEFVDRTQSGEYSLERDPGAKDALLHVPGAGLTIAEMQGLPKSARFDRTDGMHIGVPAGSESARMNEFERLEQYAKLYKPPAVKFRDLEEVVDAHVHYNLLPFEARTDFVRITSSTVLSALTVRMKVKDITFVNKDGVQRGTVNIFGSVHTLTGRVVQRFEDVLQVDVPADQLPAYRPQSRVYWKAMPLPPGRYRLNIVLKDVNSGNLGTEAVALRVPDFGQDNLAASSLILADSLENVATKDIGKGQFVIGATKVRPSVGGRFTRDQTLGVYMQVYNLATDQKTHKPSALVEYALLKDNRPLIQLKETSDQVTGAGQQMTLEKLLPLSKLPPGTYKLQVKVTDRIANQTISPTATFQVN